MDDIETNRTRRAGSEVAAIVPVRGNAVKTRGARSKPLVARRPAALSAQLRGRMIRGRSGRLERRSRLTDTIAYARQVLSIEAQAVSGLVESVGRAFEDAVALLLGCRSMTVVSGIGKSGLIGQKLSATLASTGTPGFFLHPSDAMHGDLGRVRAGDGARLISQSGESDEIVRLIAPWKTIGAKVDEADDLVAFAALADE